ncbi:MAG: AAA family ATPase [Aphanizomenon gracile PMC638.10]|nr:AAA family ATPase [Aphanizomenon gracile PMC638.10]
MPDINITSIAIENFRGISQQVVLDLVSKSNTQTNSLIIYGDNGTGKSSIVDAIQFALQGNIGRERKMSSCRSYSSNDKLPCVEIKLSDLRTITRKFYYDDNRKIEVSPHLRREESFKISPFVLRRSDILRFINTSDQKRQVVFFDYRLQSSTIEIDYEKYNYTYLIEQKENLEKEKTTKKVKRRNTTIKLAKRIGISPENIPLSKKEFDDFIRIKVHTGLKAPQRKNLNKGDLGYADPITHQYIKSIRELTQQIHDKLLRS